MDKSYNNPKDQYKKRREASEGVKNIVGPIRRRLLVPLAGVLILLTGGFVALMIFMQQTNMNQSSLEKLETAYNGFKDHLSEQTLAMSTFAEIIIRNQAVCDLLKNRDRQGLLAAYEPVFTQMRIHYDIDYFSFHRPDLVNLLRIHTPEKYGDIITRFTLRKAKHTGRTAWGIELEDTGSFTVRVVRPVFDNGILIGYLELGKKIEKILTKPRVEYGVELAVLIRKSALKSENYESVIKMSGYKSSWDQFFDYVPVYSSIPFFPKEYKRVVHGEKGFQHGDIAVELSFNGKPWMAMARSLTDASGKDIGDLVIFCDMSEKKSAFNRLLGTAFVMALTLLAVLFRFFHVLLHRTDQSILKSITSRKQAEEALLNSEKKYREIFNNAVWGIFQSTPQGRFISCNPAFARILGYDSPEEVICGISDISKQYYVYGEDREKYMKLLKKNGTVDKYEFKVRKKDGSKIWITNSTRAVTDQNGDIIYYEGVVNDITDRKRAEEEKARIEEKYRQAQKVEAIGRLAGGIAHDLNNLLVPILGYGEILLNDFSPDDPKHKFLKQIVNTSLRARELVRQLLAFSRKQTMEYKTLDLNKIIGEFKELLRRTIREDIEVNIILEQDACFIRADIGQIEQVIMNLAVNAQDAMPKGGKLTLETSIVELDEQYAKSHPDVQPGSYVMLAVSDTGCGMDEKIRRQIFEPFFSTKGEHGTGMGLATVYGIVKQHEGNIWVYSEPGKGTTFKIYLPVSSENSLETGIPEKPPEDLNGSETILLVEDNKNVRELAHTILKRLGYTVLMEESGAKALELLALQKNTVHLLLTDVVMPGMNGKELFVKAAKKCPGLKVLYMSGYTGDVIAHRGVLDEGTAFIQKPFSVKALATKVREVLDN